MQEKTFNTYFKKTIKSSSPPSRLDKFAKTFNVLPPFPYRTSGSPPNSTKFTKINSPPTLPEIDTQVQISTRKVLGPDLYDYTNKVTNIIDHFETPKLRRNPVKKVLVEKDEANLINKYRNIREKCLNNEIKLVRLLNELKEEVKSKGISEKSLTLSFEILNSFNLTYTCNDNYPLLYVKDILIKFCYLQEEDVISSLSKILSFDKNELKNIPLLFIIEKIGVNIKNIEKSHTDIVNDLKMEVKSLQEKNKYLKESNSKFVEKFRKIESESRILVDKELSSYREKVCLKLPIPKISQVYSKRNGKSSHSC